MNCKELARQTARELYDGTAVIFLGAGASMGSDLEHNVDKGVPGSGAIANMLAERFDIDLGSDADGNPLSTLRQVASLAVKNRDESTVKRFVIDQIRARCGAPLKAHSALASTNPHTVITTNYDDLYESACRDAGKPLEKVVSPEQLPRIPQRSPRLLKLHGDLEAPKEIVLTGHDYRKWQREAGGLKAKVVATLQESVCIFVGYGVGDENLRDILNIIEENLGDSSLKHFALVREVDDMIAAEWDGRVEFVAGDATEFFELVAEEHRTLRPAPFNPAAARTSFERQLSSGDLTEAGDTCKQLAAHLEEQDERAGAGSLWRSFGEAAKEAGEHPAAAAALMRAGALFLEAGYDYDAEPVLAAALSESTSAGAPQLERKIQPLLQKARLSVNDYYAVLRDTEQALSAYGEDSSASLLYSLRAARAEAREATEGLEAAKEELEAALQELPEDALYYRVRTGANLVRLVADEFNWTAAHELLNELSDEVLNARGHYEHDELRRLEAILKLVRANVHFAEGEDVYASTHYRECAPVLEELGETGFAVSALQGAMACAPILGLARGETIVRLRDLARTSGEHKRCTDLQRKGIEDFAEEKLAAARNSLARAEASANALHSPTRPRSVRRWFADVLLEASFAKEALILYAEVGDRKKVERVARSLRKQVPLDDEESNPPVDRLLELAKSGPVHSRGPAFASLTELWDVIPDEYLPKIVDQLTGLPDMLSNAWAERNVLSYAADLARLLAPRFSEEQAEKVAEAVVSTINKDDVAWTSHKEACRALANLAGSHPEVLDKLELPVDRLAELARRDLLNDMRLALMALANLGLNGHAESRRKVLELLEEAHLYTRASWRYILEETTEEELTSATRQLLPQSIDRVEKKDAGQQIGRGLFDPRFLENWDLPSAIKSEVADALSEAVADPTAALADRRAAALVLGRKATEFVAEDRQKIVAVLQEVLTKPFEAHPMLRSTDNPLSMLRINVGEADDVTSMVAWALLAFSPWVEGEEERRRLRREIERLRASQVQELGAGIAGGLRNFEPSGDEEERWLNTRLLLLLNSQHPRVRQGASRSLASLVERRSLPLDDELLDTVLHLSASSDIGDRSAAARVLAVFQKSVGRDEARVEDALNKMRGDLSYLVRIEMKDD